MFQDRLLAVPFWIVERAREIAERIRKAENFSFFFSSFQSRRAVDSSRFRLFRLAISRALSIIQKGTVSSLVLGAFRVQEKVLNLTSVHFSPQNIKIFLWRSTFEILTLTIRD